MGQATTLALQKSAEMPVIIFCCLEAQYCELKTVLGRANLFIGNDAGTLVSLLA